LTILAGDGSRPEDRPLGCDRVDSTCYTSAVHDQAGSRPTEQGEPARREAGAAWVAARLPTWIALILVVVWAYQLRCIVFGGMYLRLEEHGHEFADERARLVGNTAGLVAIVLPCLLLAGWRRAWRPASRIGRAMRHLAWPLLVASGGFGWSIAAALWGQDGPSKWGALGWWMVLNAAIAAAV
jgi:hypothetical protein